MLVILEGIYVAVIIFLFVIIVGFGILIVLRRWLSVREEW